MVSVTRIGVFALAVSAGCVRLGFWQLHRLDERRTLNAMLAARSSAAPEDVRALLSDPATAAYRRATATGVYDFAGMGSGAWTAKKKPSGV